MPHLATGNQASSPTKCSQIGSQCTRSERSSIEFRDGFVCPWSKVKSFRGVRQECDRIGIVKVRVFLSLIWGFWVPVVNLPFSFVHFQRRPPVLLRAVRECGGRLAWGENDSPHQRHDCLWRDLTDLSRSSSVAANVKLHLAPGQLCCGNVRRFNPSQQTLGTKVHDEAFLFSIYKPLPLPMVV